MAEAFRKSQFQLKVAQQMQYDDDTQFRENNTTLYLSELEEYISSLITYTAYSQELPDAAVSALSLEKMIAKRDFDSFGTLNVRVHCYYSQIEAPNSNDVNWQAAIGSEEAETNNDDESL